MVSVRWSISTSSSLPSSCPIIILHPLALFSVFSTPSPQYHHHTHHHQQQENIHPCVPIPLENVEAAANWKRQSEITRTAQLHFSVWKETTAAPWNDGVGEFSNWGLHFEPPRFIVEQTTKQEAGAVSLTATNGHYVQRSIGSQWKRFTA